MIVSSIQPCFIPWQGYFEQMLLGEVFIYLDDVQYTKKDWRNRNKLMSPGGVKNIHVPVGNASREILINEALISDGEDWRLRVLNQLLNWYKKAPHYAEVMALIEPVLMKPRSLLVDLNYELNEVILDYLGSDTQIVYSSDIPKKGEDKNMRIIEICQATDCDLLYDGKSASSFIDIELFTSNGIEVVFQDFEHTPHKQLWQDSFEPYLSIIDLLMNEGKNSKQIILANSNFSNEQLHERLKNVSCL